MWVHKDLVKDWPGCWGRRIWFFPFTTNTLIYSSSDKNIYRAKCEIRRPVRSVQPIFYIIVVWVSLSVCDILDHVLVKDRLTINHPLVCGGVWKSSFSRISLHTVRWERQVSDPRLNRRSRNMICWKIPEIARDLNHTAQQAELYWDINIRKNWRLVLIQYAHPTRWIIGLSQVSRNNPKGGQLPSGWLSC